MPLLLLLLYVVGISNAAQWRHPGRYIKKAACKVALFAAKVALKAVEIVLKGVKGAGDALLRTASAALGAASSAFKLAGQVLNGIEKVVDALPGLITSVLEFLKNIISIDEFYIKDKLSANANKLSAHIAGKLFGKHFSKTFGFTLDFKNFVKSIVNWVVDEFKHIAHGHLRRDDLMIGDHLDIGGFIIPRDDLPTGALDTELLCDEISRCVYPKAQIIDAGSNFDGNDVSNTPAKRLEGHLCPTIFTVANEHFFLDNNSFNGSLPVEVGEGALGDIIKTLHFGGNSFQGDIPVVWAKNLPNVEWLDISGNDIDGSLEPLKNMTNLEYLNVAFTNLNHSETIHVAETLAELTKLRVLDLRGTPMHTADNLLVDSPAETASLQAGIAIDRHLEFFSGACDNSDRVEGFLGAPCSNQPAVEALEMGLRAFALNYIAGDMDEADNVNATVLRMAGYDNGITLVTMRVDAPAAARINFDHLAEDVRAMPGLVVAKVPEYHEDDDDDEAILNPPLTVFGETTLTMPVHDTNVQTATVLETLSIVRAEAVGVVSPGRMGVRGEVFCPHGWRRYEVSVPPAHQEFDYDRNYTDAELDAYNPTGYSIGPLDDAAMAQTVPMCYISVDCREECYDAVHEASTVCTAWLYDTASALDCDLAIQNTHAICPAAGTANCTLPSLEPFMRHLENSVAAIKPRINSGSTRVAIARADNVVGLYDTSTDLHDLSSPPAHVTSREWLCMRGDADCGALFEITVAGASFHAKHADNGVYAITMTTHVGSRSATAVMNLEVVGDYAVALEWTNRGPARFVSEGEGIDLSVDGPAAVKWTNPSASGFSCGRLNLDSADVTSTFTLGSDLLQLSVRPAALKPGCSYVFRATALDARGLATARFVETEITVVSKPIVGTVKADPVRSPARLGVAVSVRLTAEDWTCTEAAQWTVGSPLMYKFAVRHPDGSVTAISAATAHNELVVALPATRVATTFVVSAIDRAGNEVSKTFTLRHPLATAAAGSSNPADFIASAISNNRVLTSPRDWELPAALSDAAMAVALLQKEDFVNCNAMIDSINTLVERTITLTGRLHSRTAPHAGSAIASIVQRAALCSEAPQSLSALVYAAGADNSYSPSTLSHAAQLGADVLAMADAVANLDTTHDARVALPTVLRTVATRHLAATAAESPLNQLKSSVTASNGQASYQVARGSKAAFTDKFEGLALIAL